MKERAEELSLDDSAATTGSLSLRSSCATIVRSRLTKDCEHERLLESVFMTRSLNCFLTLIYLWLGGAGSTFFCIYICLADVCLPRVVAKKKFLLAAEFSAISSAVTIVVTVL